MVAGVFYCLFPPFTMEKQTAAEQIGGDYSVLIMPHCLQMYKLF